MRANTLAIGFSILLDIASGLAEPPGVVAGAAIICSAALFLLWGLTSRWGEGMGVSDVLKPYQFILRL